MSPTKVDENITVKDPRDLESRFVDIKKRLIKPENIDKVTASWKRLLAAIEIEADTIAKAGPSYVPTTTFEEIVANNFNLPSEIALKFKERGVIMIKNVVDRHQIDLWYEELVSFCKEHPETAGYTFPNPTSWYNVFWTKPQTEARCHPNVQKLLSAMSKQFYVKDDTLPIDLESQVVYGDRIRIREPGKAATLPLHLDSSSIERWEDENYSKVYQEIFEGNWEDWDPYKLDIRANAIENLYEHIETGKSTICSAFRTLQGWLALSDNKSGEGTLRVLPNVKLSMAYIMLRPFFWQDISNDEDWQIDLDTPKFPGADPGTGQLFLPDEFFSHLRQEKEVISIPDVSKGSFVFWHADIPHEVDRQHNGDGHSSVFYYALTPLSLININVLLNTRHAFLHNKSPKDYSSQLSEEERAREYHGADVNNVNNESGLISMGLKSFDTKDPNLSSGQVKIRQLANQALSDNKFDAHHYINEYVKF
ncbi:uncharacterized protein RJT21DRAFT_40371 [Scheffersomyces amazonensis]|uniref:uncharacterized protein n=1 Tax=Scheffersomyces amazonensis TaxID=1078765 RepID=UPI00315D4836